jgi:hypothetical protein
MAWGKRRDDKIPDRLRCLTCKKGTCRCRVSAAKDRAAATKGKAPRVCGQRRSDGGTCHRTVAHGESCSGRH